MVNLIMNFASGSVRQGRFHFIFAMENGFYLIACIVTVSRSIDCEEDAALDAIHSDFM